MSVNYHTPIAQGANANAAVFNAPWSAIDQALTDMLDASLEFEALLAVVGAGAIDESALITMISDSKGFLPPRMTAAQKNAIGSPATGLIVYDTTNNEPQVYDGSAWNGFSGSGVADMVLLEGPTEFNTIDPVTINNISQEYQDLCLRLRLRNNSNNGFNSFMLRLNNVSSAGAYIWRQFILSVTSVSPTLSALVSDSDTEIEIRAIGTTGLARRYADLEIWIRNYTSATRCSGDFEGTAGLNNHVDTWGSFEKLTAGPVTRLDIIKAATATGIRGSYALYGLGRRGEIEMLDAFSVPSGPPLASPLVTDNTGTWVFVQTDGQFSIT